MVLAALDERDAAVYLFGSCARDEVRHPDDIDLGVLPRGRDFPNCFFLKLQSEFDDSCIPYDLDLVDLRKATASVLDEVLWTGIQWRP